MNSLNNLRVGARLALGFGAVFLLMLVVVVTGVIGMTAVGGTVDVLIDDRYAKLTLANRVTQSLNEQARSVRDALLMENPADREKELKEVDATRTKIGEIYSELEPKLRTEQGKEHFAKLQDERRDYLRELEPFEKMVRAGEIERAEVHLFQKLRPKQLEYMKAIGEFAAYQEKLMDEAGLATSSQVDSSLKLMVAAGLLAALAGVLAGFLVARSITRPLATVVGALKEVEAGNLTVDVRSDRTDEIGVLMSTVGNTVASLRNVVGQVRSGVDSVSTASAEIAAGNQDLSSRTEQQASSLQETAASMEQLTSTVKQSADNARQANQLAGSAAEAAERGGEVVGKVVATMDDISASSKKISDIIGVIDGIAFQTNILALNAAVEAARAGEQGRGFAVVAGEVRNLAQRSAQAAREIKSLISDSVEKVNAGSQQVADAGSAMSEIVSQVRRVTDLIGEITSASMEQSSGISQVNEAVTQMDQVTQQNAALVEQSAAAAQSLREQADTLARAVAVFRIGQHETQGAIARAAASARTAVPARPVAQPAPARTPRVEPKVVAATASAPAPKVSGSDDWKEF